jgi:peroxiredoxin
VRPLADRRVHMMKKRCILSALALILALTPAVVSAAPHALSAAPADIGSTSVQEPSGPKKPQSDEAGNSLDPVFDALWKQYVSAVRDRDELRLKLARDKKVVDSPHPAELFFKRFMALAEKDNPDAQCWVMEHLNLAVSDAEERARICREVFDLLIPKHADMDGVFRAISGIRRESEQLGDAQTTAMLEKIVDTSTNAEVRAQALLGVAWLRSGKALPKTPEQKARASEVYHQIVLAFPHTKSAKEATGYLLPEVEEKFLEAERAWVSEVSKLVAAKKPITDWPPQPMHAFEAEFHPLAESGNLTAKQFSKFIYPDYEAIEKQGPEIALTWLVSVMGERYRYDVDGWGQVRRDMLNLLYRQFPTSSAPWLTSSVTALTFEAPWLGHEKIEAVLKPLIDENADATVRGLLLFALAKSWMGSDDLQSNTEVRALLHQILAEHSDEDVALEAHNLLESLDASLPGAPAPDFFQYDSARIAFRLSEYKGRVVMLVFFTFSDEACNKTIPERVELAKRLEDRPFSVVGIDVDSPAAQVYQRESAKHGVTWRTVLLFSPKDQLVQDYMVRTYPTVLVIDADGVIRSRNAPWDETVKLVEKLVAETEAKAPKKTDEHSPKR